MRYRFGPFELVEETRELLVNSTPRPLAPQVFDLIAHLVAARERVVTQDELIAAVWKRRVVSDAAIAARISAARAALDDDGQRQRVIRTVPRRGFRFVAPVETDAPPTAAPLSAANQRVAFCRSADGTRIAYASSGAGYPLVKAGNWLTHVELDWQSPLWRPQIDRLSSRYRLLRYDQRGNGLSDWQVPELTLERFVEDLAAVVDAAGIKRFALYGSSQGAAIAVAYASRFPERVSHLILHGGFAVGRLRRANAAEPQQAEAILTLMQHGWGRAGSAFLESFAALFVPDGTREQLASIVALQQHTTTAENAIALRRAIDNFDVSPLLGAVGAPTLVMHANSDSVQPLDQGRALAAGIKGAEFVLLDGRNHILLPHEPAFQQAFAHIERFVPPQTPPSSSPGG